MPRYPQTRRGAKRMPRGQVRFWSLCATESAVTGRTEDCLADRQVPLSEPPALPDRRLEGRRPSRQRAAALRLRVVATARRGRRRRQAGLRSARPAQHAPRPGIRRGDPERHRPRAGAGGDGALSPGVVIREQVVVRGAGLRVTRVPGAEGLPPGLAPRLVAFFEELRNEDVAVGTAEILDAFEALRAVPWTEPADFREALAATVAKSQDDRRIFDLSSTATSSAPPRPRRSTASCARTTATPAASGSTPISCARRSARRSPRAARATCATSPGSRSPPSAAGARAPAWSAWTSSGSAARWACSRRGRAARTRTARRSTARASTASSATCAASSSGR